MFALPRMMNRCNEESDNDSTSLCRPTMELSYFVGKERFNSLKVVVFVSSSVQDCTTASPSRIELVSKRKLVNLVFVIRDRAMTAPTSLVRSLLLNSNVVSEGLPATACSSLVVIGFVSVKSLN